MRWLAKKEFCLFDHLLGASHKFFVPFVKWITPAGGRDRPWCGLPEGVSQFKIRAGKAVGDHTALAALFLFWLEAPRRALGLPEHGLLAGW
jgi:hypothetical protein